MKLIEISDISGLDLKDTGNIVISKHINNSHGEEDIVATLDGEVRLYSKVRDYDDKDGKLYLTSVQDTNKNLGYYFKQCKDSKKKFYILK